ncbi:MAG: hypothetical protein HY900_03960 [Deltaproteobacteria bacterium]|nr:hypothetical protein [Deltaproteobacteria bacterium]
MREASPAFWRSSRNPEPPGVGAALILDDKGRVQAYCTDSSWPFSEACVGKPARAVQPEPLGTLLERLWVSAAEGECGGATEEIIFRAPDGTSHHLCVRFARLRHGPDVYAVAVNAVAVKIHPWRARRSCGRS